MRFQAKVSVPDFQEFVKLKELGAQTDPARLKDLMGLKRKPSTCLFKEADEDGRIYPGYFAPVIVYEGGQRVVKPMRYRVRPAHSREEIPNRYNVFNARMDALLKRRTWKNIFLKNHGLFPFVRFFEWVEQQGSKRLISFNPENRDIMWVPMVYDEWCSSQGDIHFQSFALITTDPPPEIEEQGHDRCPIFLAERNIDLWLQAQELTEDIAFGLLNQTEKVFYNHQ
jgi:putative SOS response-associated peptidase YedK